MRRALLALSCSLFATEVLAQTLSEQPTELTITADPWELETVNQFLFQSEPLKYPELAPYLTSLPGVSGSRMGGHGIDPVIRGQGQSRVNIIRDGAFVFGGCPNRMDPSTSYISPLLFDDVTVVKGVKTLQHGPGGSGGTVLVNRRSPVLEGAGDFTARMHAAFGSNADDRTIGADIAGAMTDSSYVRIGGTLADANNYKDGAGRVVRSAYEQNALSTEFGVRALRGIDSAVSFDLYDGNDILFGGSEMDSPDSDSFGGLWKIKLTPSDHGISIDGELYANRVQHLMDNYSLRPLATGKMPMFADTRSNTAGGKLGTTISSGNLESKVGVDLRLINQHAERFTVMQDTAKLQSVLWPDVTQTVFGIYGESELQIDANNSLGGGLRFDRALSESDWMNRAPMGDFLSPSELYDYYYGASRPSRDDENISGLALFRHRLTESIATDLSFSRTTRSPDISERFIASNAMMPQMRWVGNPNLDAEIHHSIAPSFMWTSDSLNSSATLFYDWAHDYITRDRARGQTGVNQSDLASIYRNVDAELWGAELDALYKLDPSTSLRTWGAYVNGTNKSDSRPLAQIPPLNGGMSVNYKWQALSVEPAMRFALTQGRADTDTRTGSGLDVEETPGYITADLTLAYEILKGTTLELLCTNLLDQEYANHLNRGNVFDAEAITVHEPGRSFMLQVRAEL